MPLVYMVLQQALDKKISTFLRSSEANLKQSLQPPPLFFVVNKKAKPGITNT